MRHSDNICSSFCFSKNRYEKCVENCKFLAIFFEKMRLPPSLVIQAKGNNAVPSGASTGCLTVRRAQCCSAVSTGSQFDRTPASQFSPVSPQYSQFGRTPASQFSPASPQYSPTSPSQLAPVSDRRPKSCQGPSSSA